MAKEVLDTCQNTTSRPGDALMIAVESNGKCIRMCPGRVGGGVLIFTGSLCLLPTCLNPPGPVQNSL